MHMEMEPNTQSGNKENTRVTQHGWDQQEVDLVCHNNTKQYSMTGATLAQYRNHDGNNQQRVMTTRYLQSYNLVLPRGETISWTIE